MRLERDFFACEAPWVARELLGHVLVRRLPTGEVLRARIVETEAYHGLADSASHARVGNKGRAAIMYGEPGRAYVYLIHGMYHMLNVITDELGVPAAVLLRGVEPLEGIEAMKVLRPKPLPQLTNGPGKLCQAMAIDRLLNGEDVVDSETLWFEEGERLPDEMVARSPRINIGFADPEDQERPWRFFHKESKWVSK